MGWQAKDSVTVKLYADGADGKSIVLNTANQWKGESSQMFTRSTMTMAIGLSIPLRTSRIYMHHWNTGRRFTVTETFKFIDSGPKTPRAGLHLRLEQQ